MQIIAFVGLAESKHGPGVWRRPPPAVENAVFRFMRSLDTEMQVVEVPWQCRVGDKTVYVDYRERELPVATEQELEADWEVWSDGRCAKCGKLEGDHFYPTRERPNPHKFVEKSDLRWWKLAKQYHSRLRGMVPQ